MTKIAMTIFILGIPKNALSELPFCKTGFEGTWPSSGRPRGANLIKINFVVFDLQGDELNEAQFDFSDS